MFFFYFYLFAFIEFNPCFTIWVYHGVFTEMFPVGCLQRCLQLITFYQYFLDNRSVIWTVLGVLPNILSFRINLPRILQNLACLEITDYPMKYSTVLWRLERQIRGGRKVQTQVHTVNSNSRNSNCGCSLFSRKNSIIRILCMCGWLAIPINPDKWSSTVIINCRKRPHRAPRTNFLKYKWESRKRLITAK